MNRAAHTHFQVTLDPYVSLNFYICKMRSQGYPLYRTLGKDVNLA